MLDREMTEEEIKAQEANMIAFYNEKLPFLKAKFEHDDLCAKIWEAEYRTLMAQARVAQHKMDVAQAKEDHNNELKRKEES